MLCVRGLRRGVFPTGVETDDLFVVEVQMAVDRTRDVVEGRAVVVCCEIGIDSVACDKQVGRIELKVVADQNVDISRSVVDYEGVQEPQAVDTESGGCVCGRGAVVLWVEAVPAVVLAKEVVCAEELKNIRKIVSEVRQGAYTATVFEVAALETLPFEELGAERAGRVDGKEGAEAENGVVAHHEVGVNELVGRSLAQVGLRLNTVFSFTADFIE